LARDAFTRAAESAAARYAVAGRFAQGFARGKLLHDPAYRALIERGVAGAPSVTDLGCGRGYLLALILECVADGPPPVLRGIELAPRAARLARVACGDASIIREADLAQASIPRSAVITIVDVLHYLPRGVQDALLERARAALPAGGRLFVREADASAGSGFVAVRLAERLAALSRGDGWRPFAYRRADELARRLEALELEVVVQPMGAATPFSNVLLEARAPA
jgi:SAM-dependent methyltransferase